LSELYEAKLKVKERDSVRGLIHGGKYMTLCSKCLQCFNQFHSVLFLIRIHNKNYTIERISPSFNQFKQYTVQRNQDKYKWIVYSIVLLLCRVRLLHSLLYFNQIKFKQRMQNQASKTNHVYKYSILHSHFQF